MHAEFLDCFRNEVLPSVRGLTLLDEFRLFNIWSLSLEAISIFPWLHMIECGVFMGGSAMVMQAALKMLSIKEPSLHLFDTFQGMPDADPRYDLHKKGDFSDTSLESVRERLPNADIHVGFIPETFSRLKYLDNFSLAHIDVDLKKSVEDCLGFIWPRLQPGGWVIIDDYEAQGCPGAKLATNQFFRETLTCLTLRGPHPTLMIQKKL